MAGADEHIGARIKSNGQKERRGGGQNPKWPQAKLARLAEEVGRGPRLARPIGRGTKSRAGNSTSQATGDSLLWGRINKDSICYSTS